MSDRIQLEALLSQWSDKRQQAEFFALVCLGVIESLVNGSIDAGHAVTLFFHADNCLFVRENMRDETADQIMSRGVQLPDLFEVLPTEEAERAYQQELATMRSLCLKLVEQKRKAA